MAQNESTSFMARHRVQSITKVAAVFLTGSKGGNGSKITGLIAWEQIMFWSTKAIVFHELRCPSFSGHLFVLRHRLETCANNALFPQGNPQLMPSGHVPTRFWEIWIHRLYQLYLGKLYCNQVTNAAGYINHSLDLSGQFWYQAFNTAIIPYGIDVPVYGCLW